MSGGHTCIEGAFGGRALWFSSSTRHVHAHAHVAVGVLTWVCGQMARPSLHAGKSFRFLVIRPGGGAARGAGRPACICACHRCGKESRPGQAVFRWERVESARGARSAGAPSAWGDTGIIIPSRACAHAHETHAQAVHPLTRVHGTCHLCAQLALLVDGAEREQLLERAREGRGRRRRDKVEVEHVVDAQRLPGARARARVPPRKGRWWWCRATRAPPRKGRW